MVPSIIYSLCALTACACAFLLLSAWQRARHGILLWSGICFVGLTLSNAVLVIDKVLTPPEIDLSIWRYSITLLSLVSLLFGLIWNTNK